VAGVAEDALLERERELAALDSVLEAAAAGVDGAMVIEGPAALLADEVCRYAWQESIDREDTSPPFTPPRQAPPQTEEEMEW
jgi:hypothetical protein